MHCQERAQQIERPTKHGRPNLGKGRPQTPALLPDDYPKPVIAAPGEVAKRDFMPEPDSDQRRQGAQRGASGQSKDAGVYVLAAPAGQGNMPAPPEI